MKRKAAFVQIRRDICNACEHLTVYVGIKSCEVCGCSVWGKTMIPSAKCPEGKWDAEKN